MPHMELINYYWIILIILQVFALLTIFGGRPIMVVMFKERPQG